MKLCLALSYLLLKATGVAGVDTWNYTPDDEFGPENWASLDLGEDVVNECGGSANSPIDFTSVDTCTDNSAGAYVVNVSSF